MLRLPIYQDVSEEQDAVTNLYLRGNHLVIGPPGTGKTIMALYRAKVLAALAARARVKYTTLYLVYNKPLRLYMTQAMDQLKIQSTTQTFHSWMWKWYPKRYGLNPPTLPGAPYMPDWTHILGQVAQDTTLEKFDHLLVDEGQDLPKEFYLFARLIAENVTVFADENQRLHENNSTIEQIQTYLGVQNKEIRRLTRNYRNTRPIAEFAKEYYCGLQTGIPALPNRPGAKPSVVGFVPRGAAERNGHEAGARAQVAYVERYYRAHTQERIGVVLPTWLQQEEYLRYFALGTIPTPDLFMVDSNPGNIANLDFGRSGVFLMRYATAKGLEFDAVFLPDLDNWQINADSDIARMQFYVMCSRPRKELYLLYTGESLPAILGHVPETLYRRSKVEVDE